jgi:chemotaxis family two-component system sensor histidine kinase/response regulator PixL
MAINPNIRDQAYQFFIEEAPELLQTIEAGLLTLNQERNAAKIHNLMRSAHSLKGGAASVGLDVIATLAHRLENIFKALYNDHLATETTVEDWLLQAYDCLRLPLMEQITTGRFDAEQALAIAEPIFSQIEAHCGDALYEAESYIPSSTDMGIDMVVSIFEVDVAQGLEQLAAAIADPYSDLLGELQLQVEVFAGFAELLNLSHFGAIAETVQKAISLHPDRVSEIAQLALSEFELSRQAVLSGNRQEGSVAAALLELATDSPDWGAPIEVESMISAEMADNITEVDSAIDVVELAEFEQIGAADVVETDLPLIEKTFADFEPFFERRLEDEFFDSPSISELSDYLENDDQPTELLINQSLSETNTLFLESAELPFEQQPLLDEDEANSDQLSASEVLDSEILDSKRQLSDAFSTPQNINLLPKLPSLKWQSVTKPASTANLTVRVDADRLERMNNLVGELAVNRSSLALQNDQLQKVLRELRGRFARFQTLVNHLQTASDRTLVASEPDRNKRENLIPLEERLFRSDVSIARIEFDDLEMDRYGAVHTQVQTILENLVQLEESVEDIGLFARQSNQTLDQQQHQLTQLRDELVWARMLPLSEVLNRFPRTLRDLSVTYQKPAKLKLTGVDVLIDRAILGKLYDPLLHLLRNAFDHGIESAELRQKQGKPEQGQIEICAFHQGNQTIIEIRDDGQGLDLERISHRVRELGWLSAEQIAKLAPAQLIEMIFEPGFSTATQVNELSGRGFGLDVVRSQLQAIRGTVSVSSTAGQGTTFILSLPLTLTITQLILCLAGSLPIALPADNIEDILTPISSQLQQTDTQSFLNWREQTIPIYSLNNLLNYHCPIPEGIFGQILAAFPTSKDWAAPVIVLRREQQVFALAVERIITEQELVVKPFGESITPPSYLYGCTILGDGSPVPVVDAATLLAVRLRQSATLRTDWQSNLANESTLILNLELGAYPPIASAPKINPIPQAPTILVVDDAVTLRRTLALFLEREGYRVVQAQDGREAIDQFQQVINQQAASQPVTDLQPIVKLIICDIEMPNMNGFEFLSYRRQDPVLAAVPVAILTSRSNEKHRWLAMQLGATAYFTKPYLEQEFLTAIKGLMYRNPK